MKKVVDGETKYFVDYRIDDVFEDGKQIYTTLTVMSEDLCDFLNRRNNNYVLNIPVVVDVTSEEFNKLHTLISLNNFIGMRSIKE